MPKKKINLSEIYTRNDIKQMPIFASTVLYDFLYDYNDLSSDEKKDLLRRMNDINIMATNTDYIVPIYGNTYPILTQPIKESKIQDAADALYPEMLEGKSVKLQNYYLTMTQDGNKYPSDKMNEPLQVMQNALKTISKHMGRFMKKGRITDYEKQFLQSYKQIIDVYADGKDRNSVMARNPALQVNESIMGAMLKLKNCSVNLDVKEDGDFDFNLSIGDIKNNWINIDWRKTVGSIYETPIFNTIIKGNELQNKIEAYDKGDATTSDMIKAYDEYARVAGELVNMPKEDFDKIYRLGQLQNRYDNFVLGPRTPHYAYYDAIAKSQLLKAGYSLEDAMEMAQFYVVMKEASRKDGLLSENERSQGIADACAKMEDVWNKIISGDITEKTRVENIAAMQDCLSDIKKNTENGIIPAGTINKGSIDSLSAILGQRKEVVLDANDKLKMAGTTEDLYNRIDSIDSKVIRSSSEYRKMKSDLKKLAEVDKDKFPDKYEYLKKNAIKSTSEYIKYKNKELNNSKKTHKRSDYEFDRVKAASAVLDRLQTIDRKDFEKAQLTDKRFVVNDDMSYKNARAFIKSKWVMDHGMDLFKDELGTWKAMLINSQGLENQDKNFENTDEMVGSESYKELTVALQNCIEKLKDPNTLPVDIKKSFGELYKKADAYRKEHEGIIFGPFSGSGQTRQEMAVDMCKKLPGFVTCYDNMRRQFEQCKDENGISFMNKSYAEICDHTDNFLEIHEAQILKDPVIRHEKLFNNMYHSSLGQRQLVNVFNSKNKFMAQNYRTDIKPDYYLALNEKMSVSEMAKNYVTMKYMDRMYKKGIKPSELQVISDELKAGQLEKDAEKLANNPVFKAICKKSPLKAFSSWDAIERKAEAVQDLCRNNINNMLGGIYDSPEDYIDSKLNIGADLGKMMTNQFLASPSGKYVAQAIAADTTAKPEKLIETLEQKADATVKNYYKTHRNNISRMSPSELMNDPGFKSKLHADLVGVQDAVFKKNSAPVKHTNKNIEKQVNNMKQSPIGI